MNENSSKSSTDYSGTLSAITTPAQEYTTERRRHTVNSYSLLWLDSNIDETKEGYQNTLIQLRNVVDNIYSFTNTDECVDFLTEIHEQKAFVIVSGTLGEHLVPNIHEIPQMEAVYIYCSTEPDHEQWTKEWPKVKSGYTDITSICDAFQQAIKQSNQDSISISFIPTTDSTSIQNLDELEPSFMYTQIFKEIILGMEYSSQSLSDFTAYCRNETDASPTNINKFQKEYSSDSAIWWYTYPSFIFSMLNGALRTLESEIIIKMGFFIRDLHHQIVKLHQEQFDGQHGQTFILYRGQGLSNQEFSKLYKAKGGLIAFNCFVSTSQSETVSLIFAKGALSKPDSVGIIFKITINTAISPVPFALIDKTSYFKDEEEYLFSMHTVFRIGEMKVVENNNCLYEVELQLTTDNDEQLRTLTKQIRKETFPDAKGWHRMGQLLITIGHFNQAEKVYNVALQQATGEEEKADIYYEFGRIKYGQGDYIKAISFYEKSLLINEKVLPSNHSNLGSINNNIGSVYDHMGEYSKALSFYKKALEIVEKSPSPNHSLSANAHNNIGLVYENLGEYSEAIMFYQKAFQIREKILPPNHPSLATSYNNIGSVYHNMGDNSKALSFFEKDLEICQKNLPSNHPDLAASYNNIAFIFKSIGNYSKALSYYERAQDILQRSLPSNHPNLKSVREDIEFLKKEMIK